MEIRKACLEDIENNLLNLYQKLFEYHYNNRPEIFIKCDKETLRKKLIDTINNTIVIEEENKIQAFAIYLEKDRLSKKDFFIDQLIVDEEIRNKRYSKELINYLKKIAKEKGYSKIELCCWEFNIKAKEIYKYLGFKKQRTIYELETN